MSATENENDLQIIKEWLAKEPHLPQNINDKLLQRFLYTCNHSVERAKHLIDLFYTIRSQSPEIFADRDPDAPHIRQAFEDIDFVPLPKLSAQNYKVFLYNLRTSDPEKYHFVDALKAFFVLADVRMLLETEVPDGEIPIFDMRNFTLKHLTKIVLPVLKKYMLYTQEAHPIKLRQIHLLNVPTFLDRCLHIVRPFMKSEVGKMIHTHLPNSTTLYDHVPRDLLPEEYGGTVGKIDDLKRAWIDKVRQHRDYVVDESRWAVDERKRPRPPAHTVSMEGSFRSLSID
ncbi:alpha-tocopherol transfer protein-like [Cylas formicarius]|uniref:alpha-tocopherol transfer protein-like n=1 Tax=Cylas formicarius TaxID=197179 RepID=UPI0029589E8E|nr:alpha-tocopherol transfer protein-like [Cylas formicarius]